LPSGWVAVVVLVVDVVELVVTGAGGTNTGAGGGVVFDDAQLAVNPPNVTAKTNPTKLRTELMLSKLPTLAHRVK
jgi:hypothetical protein